MSSYSPCSTTGACSKYRWSTSSGVNPPHSALLRQAAKSPLRNTESPQTSSQPRPGAWADANQALTAGATTSTTNAETFFSDADDGMVREAWEEMQRQGSSFDFHLKPSTRALQRNAQEVGAVVAVGAGHDVAAPEKAAFRRKGR